MGKHGAAKHTWDVPVTIMTPAFIKAESTRNRRPRTHINHRSEVVCTANGHWPNHLGSQSSDPGMYIRIFGTVRWLRLVSYGLVVFMFLFYWSNVAIAAIYCTPKSGYPWDASIFARCATPAALDIVIRVLDVGTDLVLYILPFPIINNLQLALRRMIGLRFVFMIGCM